MNPFDYAQLEASMPKPITDEQRAQWAAPTEFSARGLWEAAKDTAPILGLIAGLSLLSRRGNGRNWAQALGGAGLDTLGSFGAMGAQKMAYDKQARAEARQSAMDKYNSDMQQWGQRFNLGKAQNDQYNAEQKLGIDQYNAESQRMGAQAQLATAQAAREKNLMAAAMKAEERRNAMIQAQALYGALAGESAPQQGVPAQAEAMPSAEQLVADLQGLGALNTSEGGWAAMAKTDPRLLFALKTGIENAAKAGLNAKTVFTSSWRDPAQQARLYANNGGIPAAKPGHSAHERGQAVDVAFDVLDPKTGKVTRVSPYANPNDPTVQAMMGHFKTAGAVQNLLNAGMANEGGHLALSPNFKMPTQVSPEQFMKAPTIAEQLAAETDPIKRWDMLKEGMKGASEGEGMSKHMARSMEKMPMMPDFYGDAIKRMPPAVFASGNDKNIYTPLNQVAERRQTKWLSDHSELKGQKEAYTKGMAELGKEYNANVKTLELASKLRGLLETGADTGTLSQVKNEVERTLSGIGIKNISLSGQSTERFVLETSKLLAEVLQGQKGSQSDKDLASLRKATVNPDYSPETNYATLLEIERLARKGIMFHDYMTKAQKEYGHNFEGAKAAAHAYLSEQLGPEESQYITQDQSNAIYGARKSKTYTPTSPQRVSSHTNPTTPFWY